MSKSKYTQIKPELLAMRKAGYKRQQIAGYFGLEKSQIKSWITRYNREQTVNLVFDTIKLDMRKEKRKTAAKPQFHSDQGAQYASAAYFKLTKQYGITPSISRCGNCYNNALAENFFGILKTKCIYRHKPETFKEANEMINRYIHFYIHERI